MARVGIFGGTFDPIHLGHLILAQRCLESAKLESVIFLPTYQSPLKENRPQCSDSQRIEMLKLAIDGNPKFEVSRFEIEQSERSFTIDTLRHLSRERSDDRLFFIMGSDSLANFHRWKQPREICELADLLIVERPEVNVDFERLTQVVGADLVDKIQSNIVQSPLIEISSTEIRQRSSQRQSIRYLLPRAIEKYIENAKIYLEQ